MCRKRLAARDVLEHDHDRGRADAATAALAAARTGQSGMGVGSVMRYAIQVATHIGSTGNRAVQFTDVEPSKNADGTGAVNLDVVNTGERGYRPTLWIEVYDSAGVLRAKGKQVRGLLYPGTSLRQHYDLGTLASGTYKALMFADTGVEPVFASQFTSSSSHIWREPRPAFLLVLVGMQHSSREARAASRAW